MTINEELTRIASKYHITVTQLKIKIAKKFIINEKSDELREAQANATEAQAELQTEQDEQFNEDLSNYITNLTDK